MRPLTRINLTHFRTHSDRRIRLRHPILTLAGSSDSGKSNLIRAIYWVVVNRPAGMGMIERGQESPASVSLTFGKDGKVKRVRGKSKNHYYLDSEKFSSFGNTVPSVVEAFLRMTDLNFQLQHEYLFWFTLSPGEVAKRLNDIVNLEIIDRTMQTLSRYLREQRTTISVVEEKLDDARSEKKSLRWTKGADKQLRGIEALEDKAAEAATDIDELSECLDKATKSEQRHKSLCVVAAFAEGLITATNRALEMHHDIVALDRHIGKYREWDRIAGISGLDRFLKKIEEFEELQDAIDNIGRSLSSVQNFRQTSEKLRLEGTTKQKRLDVQLRKYCPLCGKKKK